ncbi:MAG: lipopolysaccharide biosynthesis protein [Prevotella sp.]|nr:lipopolysaccharide biosynthesis protein [Prevotella sp.]
MDSLKDKTAKGLMWGILNNGTTELLNLIIGIFLARMLSPSDYGIVGVLAIFTAIAGNLQSSGFSRALINMKNPEARDYNAVFWFNILVSFAIYIILFFCAPLIAAYFRQPVLVKLSRFVFLAFVISSFGIAHNAYLCKNLMMKEMAIITFVALTVSGCVGITLAFYGKAYWSLAWQQVVYIFMVNIGRYYFTPWRPSFHVDFSPIKRMFGFSVNILFTTIINTLSANIMTFIFGRLFPMKTVGNFTQANKWNTMGYTFIMGGVSQVSQPVLAHVRDDINREKRVFRKMMRFTAFLSFPAMLGLALVADEFIRITISDKWASCVPLLQLLCIGGAFMPFHTMYQNFSLSRGRSDIYLWCNILLIALQITLVLVFAKYGITVMVGAYSALNILFLIVWQFIAHRLMGLRFIETVKDICPFLLVSAVIMVAVHFLTAGINNLIPLLLTRIILAAALYFIIMKACRVKILEECIEYFKSKF